MSNRNANRPPRLPSLDLLRGFEVAARLFSFTRAGEELDLTQYRKRPLREVGDLRHHVPLHVDDPDGRWPWLHWRVWLEVAGMQDLRPAGNLRFSGYDQVIPAAIAGHGVALGRTPLVSEGLASGDLVAPFKHVTQGARAYFAKVSRNAVGRTEVADFVAWLKHEAAESERLATPKKPKR